MRESARCLLGQF
ncbi:hypothetical protein EYZ11_012921 [Aspergillus tanneri]|uniref:Uncharacterized protein n=1 Tax=Aspergillus tanneri TaxID=1220188 RepID=A0A4S3IZG9_9EURO|nr:hypothetical protein EYZ11_012921 [Aspergillus tanneri]